MAKTKKVAVSTSKEKEKEEEKGKVKKVLIEEDRPCPHCGKEIHISWTRVTKVEPIKGEYEHSLVLSRSRESSMDEHLR
jgi:hypothetical protein